MIVVATADFEIYHEVVGALRDRGVAFTTVEPGEELPGDATVVVTGADDEVDVPAEIPVVVASPGEPRRAVEDVLAHLRGPEGRTIVGVDPGARPGIAVLSGDVVVGAFQVDVADAADTVRREVADAADPLVRVGDGARLEGARIVDALEDVRVELVDETGTTPYLGAGARGMGDVIAAINIARVEGEVVEERHVEPTPGEIQKVQERSRRVSEGNRTLPTDLARRVAVGDLTMDEALAEHRAEE
ncbi:MAG: hypothetical protein ABEJ68_11725 [Halobacteriaceae archaeon]